MASISTKLDLNLYDAGLSESQLSILAFANNESQRKACLDGKMQACTALGDTQLRRKNISQAMAFYKKACDGGETTACNSFKRIKKRLEKINQELILHKGTCDKGNAKSCLVVAGLELAKGNIDQMIVFAQKACNLGDKDSCDEIRKKKNRNIAPEKTPYDRGIIEEKRGNIAHATVLFRKACDGGEMKGCTALGAIKQTQSKPYQARTLYKKACHHNTNGDMMACYLLGTFKLLENKKKQAFKLFYKACMGGEGSACTALGHIEQEKGNITSRCRKIENAPYYPTIASGAIFISSNLLGRLGQPS